MAFQKYRKRMEAKMNIVDDLIIISPFFFTLFIMYITVSLPTSTMLAKHPRLVWLILISLLAIDFILVSIILVRYTPSCSEQTNLTGIFGGKNV